MNLKGHRLVPAAVAGVGGLAGFLLRRWQLGAIFNGMGLAERGHPATLILVVLCALAVAALAFLSSRLKPKGLYEDAFSSGAMELSVSAAAALLLLFSGVLSLMEDHGGLMLLIGFLGVLASLCLAITAAQRFRGTVPSLWLHAAPCLFLTLRLIVMFKQWSIDPVVQDYCYKLFAGIAAMCATLHLGEFCLKKGHRRITAFWCLAGAMFSAIAAADPGWSSRLLNGALCLWCAINAWQLLED